MSRPKPLVQGDALPDTGPYRPKPVFVDGVSGGGPAEVDWDDVTGKPATFPPTVGTTATTAKAGNYAPTWGDVKGKPATFPPAPHAATLVNVTADATNGIAAGNAQVVLSALAARIKALEDAAA